MNTLVPNQLLSWQGTKVSFQSSIANAWGASFLRHLNAELDKASQQDHRQLIERVCNAAQAMFNTRFQTLPDVPSYTVLGMCSLILSAYRELGVQLGSTAKAADVVERGFDRTYQAFIQNICKPLLLGSNYSPQALTKMNFWAWGERMYPKDVTKTQGANTVTLEFDISGYHHFFLEQGEPGLARIIHAADQAWIEAIAAYGQPQLAERRRARASGTGFCPFRFVSNAKRRVEPRPDVILELQINVSSDRFEADWRDSSYGTDRRRTMCGRDDDRSWFLRNPVDRRNRAQA